MHACCSMRTLCRWAKILRNITSRLARQKIWKNYACCTCSMRRNTTTLTVLAVPFSFLVVLPEVSDQLISWVFRAVRSTSFNKLGVFIVAFGAHPSNQGPCSVFNLCLLGPVSVELFGVVLPTFFPSSFILRSCL